MQARTIIAIILCCAAVACTGDLSEPVSGVSQLEHEGAVMPVHIFGDPESRSALIVVHGGPGESAILMREAVGFYRLEADHLVVYYDRRGSGISEGNIDEATLSVEQMARDLNAVVELTAAGTGVESIFLVSLDWGAAVAVEYLVSGSINSKVSGYIAVSPGLNGPLAMQRSRQEVLEIAEWQLEHGGATNYEVAQNMISFYANNPVINRYNYHEHYLLLEAIGGIVINIDHPISGVKPPGYIESLLEYNEDRLLQNWTYNGGHFLETLDVEEKFGNISLPVKLIWGAWDRLMPLSLAEDYFELLGDASSEELISVSPGSANRPYLEEGDLFFATVATWMDIFD